LFAYYLQYAGTELIIVEKTQAFSNQGSDIASFVCDEIYFCT